MAKKGLQGVNNVMRQLNKALDTAKVTSMKGFIECAIVVRRDMATTSPTVPVDTRNLDHSWFVVAASGNNGGGTFKDTGPTSEGKPVSAAMTAVKSQKSPALIMGFSANYAVFVHEDMNANFKRPGSGPKFLEAALKRNKGKMLDIIKKYTRL